MKKVFLILVALIGFGISVKAQGIKIDTINMYDFNYSNPCGRSWCDKFIRFSDNGSIVYEKNTFNGCNRDYEYKNGTYYIDDQNTVHITWSNGYKETGTLTYTSDKKAKLSLNGTTYTESDC